nr:spore development regulator vosa [Quercus suber]
MSHLRCDNNPSMRSSRRPGKRKVCCDVISLAGTSNAYNDAGRKPVDPPPIVQMNVKAHFDPNSPHVFMCASPLEGAEGDEQVPQEKVVGQQVSSLHRLKDINDEGQCSRICGRSLLIFMIFSGSAVFLVSVVSKPFEGLKIPLIAFTSYILTVEVVSNKDFKGLSESSHLSRTFSDQGVRLRLRKEPRSLGGGVKRSWQSPEEQPATQRQGAPYNSSSVSNYAYSGTGSIKRARPGSNHSNTSQFPQFQTSTTRPSYGGGTLGSSPAWSDPNQQGYMAVQTSGSASYLPVQAYNLGSAPLPWQRGLQPGSVSTQTAGSTQMPYTNTRRGSGLLGSPYYPQQNSQYMGSSRTPTQPGGNTFPDLGDFHSSSHLPEAAQSSSYLQSSNEYNSQLNSTTPGSLASEQQPYPQHGIHPTSISKWTSDTGRSASAIPAASIFASSQPPDSGVSGFQYDTVPHTPTTQYSHSQQTITHAPYSGIPRAAQQHPHNPSALTNASLSGISANLFATSSEPDWSGYSPHDGAGSQQLTDQALAQHQTQQGFSTSQHPWTR